MVLQTFSPPTGTVVLTDLLAVGTDNDGHRLGRDVPHLSVRRLDRTDAHVAVDVEYAPRPEYG